MELTPGGILRKIKDVVQGRAGKRSSLWPRVRGGHLLAHPECAVCGGKKKVEVHHKVPFHIDPARELDVTNLVTLCEAKRFGVNCHLFFGHLGNYKRANPEVEQDVASWQKRLSV